MVLIFSLSSASSSPKYHKNDWLQGDKTCCCPVTSSKGALGRAELYEQHSESERVTSPKDYITLSAVPDSDSDLASSSFVMLGASS